MHLPTVDRYIGRLSFDYRSIDDRYIHMERLSADIPAEATHSGNYSFHFGGKNLAVFAVTQGENV